MKILIIEDRIERLKNFAEFDIRSFKEITIITATDFDDLILALKDGITTLFDNFDCIAAHRSAFTNEIRDVIKDYCKGKNKSLIFFSGGITSSVFKDIDFAFLHINSKDFYSLNLKLFLINCVQHKKVNLLILQFGNKWKLSLLLNLRNNIAVALNKQIYKDAYPDNDIEDNELILRVRDVQINNLIKSDLINNKTEQILSGNAFAIITVAQINEIKLAIDKLINSMV